LRELLVLGFVRSNGVGRARCGLLRANRKVEGAMDDLARRGMIDLSRRGRRAGIGGR
jgi:hypothetical protein